MKKIWAETEMILDYKWNEFKSLSLLETYEHELTGKYYLYTKLVFDYTDFVMRCEDEETSGEYEIIVQENRDKKKMVESLT